MTEKIYKIAVIGGGSAGVMATIRSVLNNDETLLFPGTKRDFKRSRARWVSRVENMPGHLEYKKGILEPNQENLEWLETSAFKEKFHWIKDRGVKDLKKVNDIFQIEDDQGESWQAEYVILCTGLMDIQPQINGSIRDVLPYANKQSIDYCLRCDGHHVHKKEVAIIGHSNGTAWVAAMLCERYDVANMQILTHGKKLETDETTEKLIKLYNIDVYDNPIEQVLGNPKEGKLDGFILCCGTSVYAEICFVSLGMMVYNELAKNLNADLDERGFVVTDPKGESSVKNLFVAGDLRANTKKQIYTAWDTAVDSADEINGRIRRIKRERLLAEM